jgi:uncharacterized membrane protein
MTSEIAYFVLGISGSMILLLIGVISYFLKMVHGDVKKALIETGKNKGNIELVQQQLNNDVKRIEQTTQLELRNLATTVNKLSVSVEQLVKYHMNGKPE